jgi:hypothetical protein
MDGVWFKFGFSWIFVSSEMVISAIVFTVASTDRILSTFGSSAVFVPFEVVV